MSDITIKSAQYHRFQCPNCRSKDIHCIAGGKNGEPVEMLKDRCNDKNCECKCRRYYIANNGKPKKYGTIDNTSALDEFPPDRERTETDDMIDQINTEWKNKL